MKTLAAVLFLALTATQAACAGTGTPREKRPATRIAIHGDTATLSVSGTYRLRGELQRQYNLKSYATGADEDFLLCRLRLGFDLRIRDRLGAFLQLQDCRISGSPFDDKDFKISNPYHDDMDIRQGYLDLALFKEIELRFGRQQITFGDHRIFGAGNWGNTGHYVWDAARLIIHNPLLESHFFVGRYIIRDPDRWPNRHMPGPTAYACYTSIKGLPLNLDLFYILKRDTRGKTKGETGIGDLNSHSFGFRLDGTKGNCDYAITFVQQLGNRGGDRIRAHGLATRLGYTFGLPWHPHLMFGFVNGSGDNNPHDGTSGTFDGVFGGSDRVLYGWINLFFWSNIREYRTDLVLRPKKDLRLRGEYHYFTLDEKKDAWYFPGRVQRRDPAGRSGRELGHELDMVFYYDPTSWCHLMGGYCLFFPGEFIRNTGTAPGVQWGFLQTKFYF